MFVISLSPSFANLQGREASTTRKDACTRAETWTTTARPAVADNRPALTFFVLVGP